MKILVAEDTRDLNRAVTAVLEHYGYEVYSAYDGQEAEDMIINACYDLAILDIMMPKKNGLDVLKSMRDRGDTTPVLILTAKSELDDKVKGFALGADDFVTKPFEIKELVARVTAFERRSKNYTPSTLSFGNTTLSMEAESITSKNSISLSNVECRLLRLLILNRSRDLDSSYISEHIWGNPNEGSAVWLYISYLKGKLSAVNADMTISGSRGGSYRLVAE